MQGAEKGQGQALVPLRCGLKLAALANKATPVSFLNPDSKQLKHEVLQGVTAGLYTGAHGHLAAATVDDKGGIWGGSESGYPSKELASSRRLLLLATIHRLPFILSFEEGHCQPTP